MKDKRIRLNQEEVNLLRMALDLLLKTRDSINEEYWEILSLWRRFNRLSKGGYAKRHKP